MEHEKKIHKKHKKLMLTRVNFLNQRPKLLDQKHLILKNYKTQFSINKILNIKIKKNNHHYIVPENNNPVFARDFSLLKHKNSLLTYARNFNRWLKTISKPKGKKPC